MNQVDIDSMGDKGLITDEVIQFVMQSICEKMEKELINKPVTIIGPNVVYYTQKHDNIKDIKYQKRGLQRCQPLVTI